MQTPQHVLVSVITRLRLTHFHCSAVSQFVGCQVDQDTSFRKRRALWRTMGEQHGGKTPLGKGRATRTGCCRKCKPLWEMAHKEGNQAFLHSLLTWIASEHGAGWSCSVPAQLMFLFLQPPLGHTAFPSLSHSPCRVLEKAIYLEPTGRQVQTSCPPAVPSRSSRRTHSALHTLQGDKKHSGLLLKSYHVTTDELQQADFDALLCPAISSPATAQTPSSTRDRRKPVCTIPYLIGTILGMNFTPGQSLHTSETPCHYL